MGNPFDALYRALIARKQQPEVSTVTLQCPFGNPNVDMRGTNEGIEIVLSGVDVERLDVSKKKIGRGVKASLRILITQARK